MFEASPPIAIGVILRAMLVSAMTTCLGAAGAGFAYATVWPTSGVWGPVIWHGRRNSGEVSLTFDDGPTPGTTEKILDILSGAGIPATFFVIGQSAQSHQELIHRIHEEGHVIANHTWHHFHHGWMRSRQYWESEIRRTDDLLEQIIGVRPTMFRPPVGMRTWITMATARQLGHTTVTWSCRGCDGISANADRILKRLRSARGGDIILLHDGIEPNYARDPRGTISALPRLLDWLAQRELTPVSLDRLLYLPACAPVR